MESVRCRGLGVEDIDPSVTAIAALSSPTSIHKREHMSFLSAFYVSLRDASRSVDTHGYQCSHPTGILGTGPEQLSIILIIIKTCLGIHVVSYLVAGRSP